LEQDQAEVRDWIARFWNNDVDDGDREPTDLDVASVLTEFVPLSKLMAEQITGLRNWSKGRARLATSPGVEKRLRKMG
jgi:hypothetical protein